MPVPLWHHMVIPAGVEPSDADVKGQRLDRLTTGPYKSDSQQPN